MDKTLIIIFYVITFIIVISIFNKRDNLEEELSFLPGTKDSLIDYYETKPNENFIENNLQEFKNLEDKRHAMLLEQMKTLSRTNSRILENQSKSTTTIVNNSSSNDLTETQVNFAGQTFRQLITQQPRAFSKGTNSSSSTLLQLSWTFDNILPKYENDVISKLNFLGLDPSGNFGNTLPYIKYIKIQLFVDPNWETIPTNLLLLPTTRLMKYSDTDGMIVNGNIENSESKTFNILKSSIGLPNGTQGELSPVGYNLLNGTSSIKLRVFGVNNAPDGAPPTLDDAIVSEEGDSRIILYKTNFEPGQPSTVPTVKDVNNIKVNSFNIVLEVSQTEQGIFNSIAKIKEVDVKYEESESLGYGIAPSQTSVTEKITVTPPAASATEFSLQLNNLEPGMKYVTNFQTTNTLDAVSVMTTDTAVLTRGLANQDEVVVTDPPPPLTVTVTSNTPNITIDEQGKKEISCLSYHARNLKYYATQSVAEIIFNNTNTQTFEITNPETRPTLVNNFASFKGIGKNVDGPTNLCILSQRVLDIPTLNGSIYFPGFSPSYTTVATGVHSFSAPIGTPQSRGFRIQGTFSLNKYNLSTINHSTNPRTFECSFERNTDYSPQGGTDTVSSEFVIDNLSNNPDISGTNVSIATNEIIYTMGIPSVKSIDLIPESRNYSDVNSSNGFLDSNLKIADFTYTGGNTSDTTNFVGINTNVTDLTLNNNSEINLSGSYTTSVEFKQQKREIHQNIQGPLLQSTLNYRDRVYNLIQSTVKENSVTFKIHSDRVSYNSSFVRKFPTDVFFPKTSNGTSLLSQLQTDPTNKIFELINQNDTPDEFAMLFYENTFSTNVLNYPDQLRQLDSTFFTDTPFDYNDGTNGMILSLPTNSDAAVDINQAVSGKYKMVLFKINDLQSSDFGLDITDSLAGAVKAKSLENYLINVKHVPSNVVQECRTPYQNSFMLVYAKKDGNWVIGSPSITYKSLSNAWWNRRYIKATGDTSITEFYLDSEFNGCKHYTTDKVSIVYEVSGTQYIDLNSIYILVATKI